MNKISEQDLILYHYKELSEKQLVEIDLLLKSDQKLFEQYRELKELLSATELFEPAPVAANFEQNIWQRVKPEIEKIEHQQTLINSVNPSVFISTKNSISDWLLRLVRHPAPGLALVVVLVSVAYFIGRHEQQQDFITNPTQQFANLSSQARNALLFQSVSTHLERSSRLLTTVSLEAYDNGLEGQDKISKSEQQWAKQLLMSNRLFTKAAEQSGQWRIVAILDEMEPLLIEMTMDPQQSLSTRSQLQQRIKTNALAFKTKVFKVNFNQEI